MLPNHHPAEDLLVGYAAGTLREGAAVLVATHLALCPHCRGAVRAAEAVGGELLNEVSPAPIDDACLNAVLDRLDEPTPSPAARPADADTHLPRPLRDYVGRGQSGRWLWRGNGVRYLPLLADEDGSRLGLMSIAPGTAVPHHGHTAEELTMVLAGGFSDHLGQYLRGDVELADESIRHQPVADRDGPCLCLVVTRGPIRPTGLIARCLTPFFAV